MQIFITDLNLICNDTVLIEQYIELLPQHEQKYYHNNQRPKRKMQFLVGRILLRTILGNILNTAPKDILIIKTPNGKLELADKSLNLHFNISHSNSMVALATHDSHVGIDIEFMKTRDFDGIADTFFTKKEAKIIHNIKDKKTKKEQFYIYWSRKEAFIKCLEDKISTPLSDEELGKGYNFRSFCGGDYTISLACKAGMHEVRLPIFNIIPLKITSESTMTPITGDL